MLKTVVVYLITYIPWENNQEGKPFLYVGSTSQNLDRYFGSVYHKEYREMWKKEVKEHPGHFRKEVLCNCITNDKKDLLWLEHCVQKQLDVCRDSRFFNRTYAAYNGFFGVSMVGSANPMWGVKRPDEWRRLHSERMTEKGKNEFTIKKRSKSQKEAQNREETVAKKSEAQKAQWETNANLQNSKAGWFPSKEVRLKDKEFSSTAEFEKWIMKNGLIRANRNRYDAFVDYTVFEFITYNKVMQEIGTMKCNLSEIYYVLSTGKQIPYHKDTERTHGLIKRINEKYKHKMGMIKDLIIDVLDSDILSNKFLSGVRHEIVN